MPRQKRTRDVLDQMARRREGSRLADGFALLDDEQIPTEDEELDALLLHEVEDDDDLFVSDGPLLSDESDDTTGS